MRDLFRGIKNKNATPVENDETYNKDYYNGLTLWDTPNTAEKTTAEDVKPEPTPEPVKEPEPIVPDVQYVAPETIADAADIVDALIERCVVYVDISNVKEGHLVRIFDYMMGASRALGCVMKQKDGTTLVAAPNGVDIDEYLDEDGVSEDGYESEYEDDDTQE